jgi:NNP family nitrate/nitrite transporter-like MFS transporter
VLATAGKSHPRVLVLVYLPLVVVAAALAWARMDNLATARNDKRAIRDVSRDPHAWVMSLLYIGTFGSFIGFSFAFGQVLQVQFASDFPTPLDAAYLTFLGPLLGSLVRPFGGVLADRVGGALVTFWTFVAMAAGAGVVLSASLSHSLPRFVVGFTALFVLSGIGNGATYKMIPALFTARSVREIAAGRDPVAAERDARRLSGALIGLAGAVGAFGGVLVNVAFRQSFLTTHDGNAAYATFLGFYGVCLLVTWAVYLRPAATQVNARPTASRTA